MLNHYGTEKSHKQVKLAFYSPRLKISLILSRKKSQWRHLVFEVGERYSCFDPEQDNLFYLQKTEYFLRIIKRFCTGVVFTLPISSSFIVTIFSSCGSVQTPAQQHWKKPHMSLNAKYSLRKSCRITYSSEIHSSEGSKVILPRFVL